LDIVKVVCLGLAQIATLVAFLLLMMDVVNALTPEAVGTEAVSARNRAFLELGGLVCVAVVHAWLRAAEFSVSEKVGYRVVRDLRMHMYGHLQGMTPRQLQDRARGGLLLRFIGDLSMLRMWISRGLLGGLVAVLVLVGTIVVLVVLNPWIGLAVSSVLLGGAAASLTNGKRMRQATRTMRRRRSVVTGNVDEQINALPVIQVFGRARGEYARLSRQNDALNRSLCLVAELRGRLRGISAASGLLAVVVVLAVGLMEVRHGYASVGLVVASILVTRQLNAQVRTLGLAHDYWHRAQVSRQKIGEFLRSTSRGLSPAGLDRLVVRHGLIEFRDVSVSGALSTVTLTAQPGEFVAITGGTGAGKSSLLGLVARLLEPDAGEVLVDGQVLAKTTPTSTFRYVGAVGPDLPLMRGSVRRNLTYSAPNVEEAEIERVVLMSGLDEVLAALPHGLETWVTEGGRNLSAAQRQRIALARAMLGNPRILLLDEPTASLDQDSKAEFRRTLARHEGTVLLVTHDSEELALADQVWILEQGRVVEILSGDDHARKLRLAHGKDTPWRRPAAS